MLSTASGPLIGIISGDSPRSESYNMIHVASSKMNQCACDKCDWYYFAVIVASLAAQRADTWQVSPETETFPFPFVVLSSPYQPAVEPHYAPVSLFPEAVAWVIQCDLQIGCYLHNRAQLIVSTRQEAWKRNGYTTMSPLH